MRKKSNTLKIVLVIVIVLALIVVLQFSGVVNFGPRTTTTTSSTFCRDISKSSLSQKTISSLESGGDTMYNDVYNCLSPAQTQQVLTILGGPANCGCPYDYNPDGQVNSADLAQLLGAWGPNPGSVYDINNDGQVNSADLAVLLGAWGPCATTETSCTDSCDNDNDLLVDCEDVADCQGLSCSAAGGAICQDSVCQETTCTDVIDNDNDLLVDCEDVADCSADVACQPSICEWSKILALDGASSDEFGSAVDIEQGWAFVGVQEDDDNGASSGSVYVYKFDSLMSTWVQHQKLHADDATAYDFFGTSVAVSGNAIVIGARGDDDKGSTSGSAYVFRLNGSQWEQEQKLLASDGAMQDTFGRSVSISGNVIVTGAQLDDDNGLNSGSAYVFRYYSTSSTPCGTGPKWCEEQKLIADDGAPSELFGISTAVSGNVIIIGAYWDNDNGGSSGSAYIFRDNGDTWIQEQKLMASDGSAYDYFGFSVDISGDKAVVGAYNDFSSGNGPQNGKGSAYVYEYDGVSSSWDETKLLASDGSAYDWFGYSVSISGGKIIIGAHQDGDQGSVSGSAYIFVQSGPDWVEESKILASDGVANDRFGWSVAMSADRAIVGANWDGDNGFHSGSAYVLDC